MHRDRPFFLAVILVSLGLNLTAVWWGLPSRFAWAPDELQPATLLQGIEERFSGDWHEPAYPPFHYYVLAATYLPVVAADAVDLDGTTGRTLLYALGRAVSILMGVGVLLLVHAIGSRLYGPRAGVFAALVAALTTTFVYYSKFANLDVPAAFWALASILAFLQHVETRQARYLYGFAVLAAVAMCTKDQAYAFYVLPFGAYLWDRFRRGEPVVDRVLVQAAAVGLGSFLILHNVVFNFWGFVHHFEEILWARSHYSSFDGTFVEQTRLLGQSLRHLRFALGWPLAAAAVVGVALAIHERRERALPIWVLLFALSYYGLFVAPVRSTWLRYSVPLSLLLAIYAGRVLASLWASGRPARRAATALALVYSLAHAASVDVLLLGDSRYGVERWLAENVDAGEVVGFVGPEYYLPRLDRVPARRLRPTMSVLERARPDYLVVNPEYAERFEPGSREHELFSRLSAGRAGYGLALEHRGEPSPMLLDFDGILGNMAKIDPLIQVYQRAD